MVTFTAQCPQAKMSGAEAAMMYIISCKFRSSTNYNTFRALSSFLLIYLFTYFFVLCKLGQLNMIKVS